MPNRTPDTLVLRERVENVRAAAMDVIREDSRITPARRRLDEITRALLDDVSEEDDARRRLIYSINYFLEESRDELRARRRDLGPEAA